MPFETIQLGEVLRHRKGSITIDDATTYKLCRVQVHRRGVVLRQKILGAEISTKNQQVCKAGDFLVAEMDAKVGGYGFVPPELDGAIVSSHYFLFEVDETRLHPPYLNVISQTQILQQQIVSKGSTNYASIRPAQVLSWEISLPDLAEQKRIANLYQTVQSKLALATAEFTKQETLLAQLQQAILQEAIAGKLTADWRAAHPQAEPARQLLHRIQAEKARLIAAKQLRPEKPLPKITPEEIPFAIPKTWEWCRLGSVIKFWNGYAFGSQEFTTEGVPVIRISDLVNGIVNTEKCPRVTLAKASELASHFWIPKGALLIAMSGATIGKTAINNSDVRLLLNQRVGRIEVMGIDVTFVKLFLDSIIQKNLEISYGAAQPNLSTEQINETIFALPPLAEQAAIVARVETLLGSSRLLAQELAASRTHAAHLLQAVLKSAFTPV